LIANGNVPFQVYIGLLGGMTKSIDGLIGDGHSCELLFISLVNNIFHGLPK
jgi:hypothetical protein